MFRCNLTPLFLAECPGSFTCHCSNTRVERTLNKSQHTKLTLEKKILLPLLQDLNSQPVDRESVTLKVGSMKYMDRDNGKSQTLHPQFSRSKGGSL